eukprot:scaffold235848_cov52-Attheya_sp.AAC.1
MRERNRQRRRGGREKQRRSKGELSQIHRNAAQHAAAPKVALSLELEASIDQSIQDHFKHGFSYLDRRHSYPFYRGGARFILSKLLPAKVQWIQNLVTARERQWRLQGRTGPDALMHPD